MSYILKVSRTAVNLLKDGNNSWDKTGQEVLNLVYKVRGIRNTLELPLSSLQEDKSLKDVLEVLDKYSDVEVFLKPRGLSSDPLERELNISLVELDRTSTKPQNLIYTLSYSKKLERTVSGVSDYKYLRDFMPSWSTARKFYWSSHAKTVEPFFTNLKRIPKTIKRVLEGSPTQDFSEVDQMKTLRIGDKSTYVPLSKNQERFLINTIYRPNSNTVLDFGYFFNNIYIETLGEEYDFDVIIEGEYNSAWFTETLNIKSSGVHKLKNKYHKLFNVFLIPKEDLNPDLTFIRVSNYLDFNSFKFEERPDSYLEYEGGSLKLKDKTKRKEILEFILPLSNASGYYITKEDHIYCFRDNKLYIGKLDAKIDLNIDKDVTYNNSRFIEETKLSDNFYELEMFLSQYLDFCSQDVMAVKVQHSNGDVFYLNGNLELEKSLEPIYIPSDLTKDSKSITLTLDLIHEYTKVSLEDYENRHIISHLICQPRVDLYVLLDLLEMNLEGHTMKTIEPLIIEDKMWLKCSFSSDHLYNSLLIPLEANNKDSEYPRIDHPKEQT